MKLPHVTDHAVCRYLERARGFDIEAVRRHIAELCAPYVNSGAATIHAEGVRFELGTGKVITVVPNGKYKSRTARDRLARGGE
jgi:hypothetical protein